MKTLKPPYEMRRTCQNCGVPNFRGIFCAKCDKIIYVSFRFDSYIADPEQRLSFLQGLQRHNVGRLEDLRAEAQNRNNNAAMHALATRIAGTIGNVPLELQYEIFRRGLAAAVRNADYMAKGVKQRQERSNAAFAAMAQAVPEKRVKPTEAEKAYADFDAAEGEGETF